MPGNTCAVSGCIKNSKKVATMGEDIHFFVFPKTGSDIYEKWLKFCKRNDGFNPGNSRICSLHFSENQYERDLRNELLGLPIRKKLLKTAVPTILPLHEGTSDLPTSREMRQLKRQNKAIVQDLLKYKNCTDISKSKSLDTNNEHIFENISYKNPDLNVHASLSVIEISNNDSNSITSINTSISVDYEKLYQELVLNFNSLRCKYLKLRRNSTRKIKTLKELLKYYKLKNHAKTVKTKKSKIETKLLNKVLTSNQIALLANEKKRVNWTRDEISTAFTIRYYSQKCYIYLQKKLNYPLPALSTLRRWAAQVHVSQGLLHDILFMLKLAGESLSALEKTIVLAFDEVKIKSVEEYSPATDEILGPYDQMQVVMARALFSNWKQPVFIAFDQKMTKKILEDIIIELSNISYNVVAIVSDCGASNIGLWKELGVTIDCTSFKNPTSENNIYVFADAPHLLKLIRNWLLDVGFQLEDGTLLTKQPLNALVSLTETEVNACWKIKRKHIECEGGQRQNVRLAAQLLSNTVSSALIRYKPGEDKKMAHDLGSFIGDVNVWFDIFNSYVAEGNVPTKNAYGLSLEKQEEHLKKMLNVIFNMRPIKKKSLQIFQKGMIISIKSLINLFYDMKTLFNVKYICTHKLNQDCLENFFFQIRSRGPNEHPSALTAIHRIRMIILGKNPGILEARVNTAAQNEGHDEDEYIIPKVLNKANINVSQKNNSNASENKIPSFSSSASSENSVELELQPSSHETTHDALEYIAGYLAKKHRDKFPNLGDYTYKLVTDHAYNIPSWVEQLSYGGLTKPTDEWLQKIKKWNKYFEEFHGESYRKGPGIVKILSTRIFRKENVLPYKLIYDFCKLRTIIRMNFRNIQAAQSKYSFKRKSNCVSNSKRSKLRKLNKTVN